MAEARLRPSPILIAGLLVSALLLGPAASPGLAGGKEGPIRGDALPETMVLFAGRLRDPRPAFAVRDGRPWLTAELQVEIIEAPPEVRARLAPDSSGRFRVHWSRSLDEDPVGPRLFELTWRPLLILVERIPAQGKADRTRPDWRLVGAVDRREELPMFQPFGAFEPGREEVLWSWPPPALAFLFAVLGFGLAYAVSPRKNPELEGLKPRIAGVLGFAIGGAPMLCLPWLHAGIVCLVGGLPDTRLTGLALVNVVTFGLLFACARYLQIDVAAALISTLVLAIALLILPVPLAMRWCL